MIYWVTNALSQAPKYSLRYFIHVLLGRHWGLMKIMRKETALKRPSRSWQGSLMERPLQHHHQSRTLKTSLAIIPLMVKGWSLKAEGHHAAARHCNSLKNWKPPRGYKPLNCDTETATIMKVNRLPKTFAVLKAQTVPPWWWRLAWNHIYLSSSSRLVWLGFFRLKTGNIGQIRWRMS